MSAETPSGAGISVAIRFAERAFQSSAAGRPRKRVTIAKLPKPRWLPRSAIPVDATSRRTDLYERLRLIGGLSGLYLAGR